MSIQSVVRTLTEHVERVEPGQPYRLTDAHKPGEGVWQGDLGLEIVKSVPRGYERVDAKDIDRQLVPLGGGPGSHHMLRSLDGVTLYRPEGWGESDTDLRGPCVVFDKPNAIEHNSGTTHPHGTVFIDAPMTVLCRYQRNLAADEREARRAAD